MAKLASVQKNIESKTYPGVFFRDVSFADLKEFRAMANSIDADRIKALAASDDPDEDAAFDAMEELGPILKWLWTEVIRAEDGTQFTDAVADPEVAGVIMSVSVFQEFQELSSGNSRPPT